MQEDHNLEKKIHEVEKAYSTLISTSGQLEKRLTEIDEYFKATKKSDKEHLDEYASLKKIFNSVVPSIKKFKSDKQSIGRLLKTSQDFYEKKFIPLRNFVNDPDVGLNGTVKFSQSHKKEIDRIGSICLEQYKKISQNVKLHESTLKNLSDLDVSVRKIFTEITFRGTKSDEITKDINFSKRLSDGLLRKIKTNESKSTELKTEIENLQEIAESTLELINQYREKSELAYKGILDIYEIAADTGRSGEFDRRRKALTYELVKWDISLRYVTIFLLVFVVAMFCAQLYLYSWNIKEAGSDVNFYLRFLLASPIIFYISFCSIQYTKVRKLIDQYTFKTTLAVSIKSHLELLRNDEKFNEEKHIDSILKFTIEALQNIYKEPYNDDKMRMHLKVKEIELKLGKDNLISTKIEKVEEKLNEVILQLSSK